MPSAFNSGDGLHRVDPSSHGLTDEEVEQLIKEATQLLYLCHNWWGGCELLCAMSEPLLHRLEAERYPSSTGEA